MNIKLIYEDKIPKNTLLLIYPDVEIKNQIYILKRNKSKKMFIIPVIFIKYLNRYNISAKITCDYNNDLKFKKVDIINLSNDCCRIIDDF